MQGLRPKRHQVFLAVVEEDLDTFFLQKTLAPAGFEWRVTRYNLHSLTATIWRTHDCLAWDPPHQKITHQMDWRDGVEVLALELDVRTVSLAVCNVYQKQRHVQGARKLLALTDHWSLLVAGDYNDPTQPCSQCLPPTRRAATRQCSSSTSTTSGSSTPGSPPTRGERADHTNESGDLTPGATWHVQPTLTSDPYATIINYSIAPPPPR